MMSELRTQTTVLSGHRIEIAAPGIPEGTRVDVIIVPSNGTAAQSALDIIESLRGHRLFQTPDQVKQHLQEERDAWDR